MIKFLKSLWFGTPGIRLSHPVFGRLELKREKQRSYWHRTEPDALTVTIETYDGAPPTEEQAAFYEGIVNEPDLAYSRAAPLVVPAYEKVMERPFPPHWRDALLLVEVNVPLAGSATNPWLLTFECTTEDAGHLFVCYFESGCPVDMSIYSPFRLARNRQDENEVPSR